MNEREILTKTIKKIEGAYASSTIRAYKSNFERFIVFCENLKASALPANPDDIASYISYLTKNGLTSASIRIGIASISTIHRLNQIDDPTLHPNVKIEVKKMHRKLGRMSKQAFGINAPLLEKMLMATKSDLQGLRDRALLLLAYDTLCRRSELTSLRFDDIKWDKTGIPLTIRLRKSKTDQEAIGRSLKLNIKTQKTLQNWIYFAKIIDGYLFRGVKNDGTITQELNPGQINRIYKRLARAANLPNEIVSQISGHSLRVGATQDLLLSGMGLAALMNKGRWSKLETAMRYAENAGIYPNPNI